MAKTDWSAKIRFRIQLRRCEKSRPVSRSRPHRNCRRTQREMQW